MPEITTQDAPQAPTAPEAPSGTTAVLEPKPDASAPTGAGDPSYAEDDASLDAILKGEGGEGSAEAQPSAGRPAPKADSGAVSEDRIKKAYAAVLRSGMDRADAEALLESNPEAFVRFGEKAARSQASRDAEFTRLKAARKDTPGGAADSAKAQDPVAALKAKVDPFLREMDVRLGEDAKPLAAAFNSLLDEIGELRAQTAQAIRHANDQREIIEAGAARSALSKDFAQIADDGEWDKVMAKAREIIDPRRHADVGHVLREAAAILYAAPNQATLQKVMAARHRARDHGQPMAQGVTTPPRAATRDEEDDAWLDKHIGR